MMYAVRHEGQCSDGYGTWSLVTYSRPVKFEDRMKTLHAPLVEGRTSKFDDMEAVFEIPAGVDSLGSFRQWSRSDTFPNRGSICWCNDTIIIDMSPERFGSHNAIKTEFTRVFANLNVQHRLGRVCSDRFRFVHEGANLSTEPDLLFVSRASLRRKRAEFIAKADGRDDIEVAGAVDVVLEICSPGSISKDYERMMAAYHLAGVREYWLVDALGDETKFAIHTRGPKAFAALQSPWQISKVFQRKFRLVRKQIDRNEWDWRLESRPVR